MSEPQPDSGELATDDPCSGRWFTVLWPLAVLFHLAANPAHLLALRSIEAGRMPLPGLAQLALAGAAIAVIVRPSPRSAIALAGLYLAVLWLKLPMVGNHEVILGLVAAAVGVAAGQALRGGDSGRSDRLGWVSGAAATCRWVLVISYLFIAVSKLNSGFFDPAFSCATVFLREFSGLFGIALGAPGRLAMVAIVVIVATELAIPLLLLSGRFRVQGAVLGLVFHFVLALDPIGHVWDFSATLLPLFLLFMPPSFLAGIEQRYRAIAHRLAGLGPSVVYLVIALATAAHGAVVVGPWADWIIAYPMWLLLSGPIVGAAVSLMGQKRVVGIDQALRKPERLGRPTVVVAAAAVLIGLGPYTEIRSAASFNMYSNLQVADGRSNHYLLGSLRFGESATTTEIVAADPESPLAFYVGTGLAVPNENLRRYLADHPDDRVTLAPTSAPSLAAGSDPSGLLAAIADKVRYKLAFRRAVDNYGAVNCQRAWGPLG